LTMWKAGLAAPCLHGPACNIEQWHTETATVRQQPMHLPSISRLWTQRPAGSQPRCWTTGLRRRDSIPNLSAACTSALCRATPQALACHPPRKHNLSRLHLHLLSDSTGETLEMVAKAALAQFDDADVIRHFWPMVRSQAHLDRILGEIADHPGLVLFTLVNAEIRQRLEERCRA